MAERRRRRLRWKPTVYNKSFRKLFAKEFYDVHRGKQFDFNSIIRIINDMRRNEYKLWICEEFLKVAYEILDEYDCRDAGIITGVVSFKFKFLNVQNDLVQWRYAYGEINSLMTTPYKDVLPCFYNPVFSEVLRGKCDLVERFLRYGLMCRPPYDHYSEWLIVLDAIEKYLGLKTKPLLVINKEYVDHLSEWQRGRLLMVLRSLRIMVRRYFPWQNSDHDSVRCYRIVYETIPDCHITSGEVAKCLRRVAQPLQGSEALIKQICEHFEQLFPTSKGPYRPRSLLHLSRCRVRESMRAARTIWFGVQYLDIPLDLKHYLMPKRGH